MGMELRVTFGPDAPPLWPAVAELLTTRGLTVQMRMIDGELAFPDATPPANWRELPLRNLLLVVLCGAVYAFRRQTYFLYWTLAWLSFSLWLLFGVVRMQAMQNAPDSFLAAPVVRALLQDAGTVCSWFHVVFWLFGLR